jgi:hypothetical protein
MGNYMASRGGKQSMNQLRPIWNEIPHPMSKFEMLDEIVDLIGIVVSRLFIWYRVFKNFLAPNATLGKRHISMSYGPNVTSEDDLNS